MDPATFRTNEARALAVVAVGAVFVLLAAVSQAVFVYHFGQLDFLQYWAAARAVAEGSNPYEPATLAAIQRTVCGLYCAEVPVLLWNPPIIIPLIFPFGLLPFLTASLIWNVLNFFALIAALVLILQSVSLSPWGQRLFLCFALLHYPIALNLYYGQSSPLILLGLAMYLRDSKRDLTGKGTALSQGIGLALTALKPHLLFLPYALLTGQVIWRRRLPVVLTGMLAVGGLLVAGLLMRGSIVHDYVASVLHSPPFYWKTPTVGSFLQGLGLAPRWRLVPAAVSGLCALIWAIGRKGVLSGDLVLVLLPFSLLLSPYGWTYDQMVLLPAVAWAFRRAEQAAERRIRIAVPVLIFLLDLGLLFPIGGVGQEMTIWYPAALAGLCVALYASRPGSTGASEPLGLSVKSL